MASSTPLSGPTVIWSTSRTPLPHTSRSLVGTIFRFEGSVPLNTTLPLMLPPSATATASYPAAGAEYGGHVAALDFVAEGCRLHAVEMPDAAAAELQTLARQVGDTDVEVQALAEPLLSTLGGDPVDVRRQQIARQALMLLDRGL